ncbi:MAG: NTP transferase domain-containing protein [Chloroflexota bacterium]
MTLSIILLAAGKGTRMNSKYQKILHEVGGKPMVQHIFEAAVEVSDNKPVLVVSHDEDGVQSLFGETAVYVEQAEKLGTGHATQMAKSLMAGKSGQVIVTYGDMPLLRPETLIRLAKRQSETKAVMSLLTVAGSPESSFGRIVRGEGEQVLEIVEVAEVRRREVPDKWLNIRELNVGVYCFDAEFLWQNIDNLPQRQARNGIEYYLTDMVETAVSQNKRVEPVLLKDIDECLGAGTRQELVDVEKAFRQRANQKWLTQGVTLIDPDATYIDQDVIIGKDTVVWPNSFIQKGTTIGEDCIIGPNTTLRASKIGQQCVVEQALLHNQEIPDHTEIYGEIRR